MPYQHHLLLVSLLQHWGPRVRTLVHIHTCSSAAAQCMDALTDTPRCTVHCVTLTCRTALRGPRHGPDHLDDEGHGHVPDTDAPPTAEPSRHALHANGNANGNGHAYGDELKYDGSKQAVAEAVVEAKAPAADSGGEVVLHMHGVQEQQQQKQLQGGSEGGAEGRLEFQPVVLAFWDVSYYVPHPAEKGTEQVYGRVTHVCSGPPCTSCLMLGERLGLAIAPEVAFGCDGNMHWAAALPTKAPSSLYPPPPP